MTSDHLTPILEQRVVMTFLVTVGSEPTEIHQRLLCVFGEQVVDNLSFCHVNGHPGGQKIHTGGEVSQGFIQGFRDQPK